MDVKEVGCIETFECGRIVIKHDDGKILQEFRTSPDEGMGLDLELHDIPRGEFQSIIHWAYLHFGPSIFREFTGEEDSEDARVKKEIACELLGQLSDADVADVLEKLPKKRKMLLDVDLDKTRETLWDYYAKVWTDEFTDLF